MTVLQDIAGILMLIVTEATRMVVVTHLPSLAPTLQVVPPLSLVLLISIAATLHRMPPRQRRSPVSDIPTRTTHTTEGMINSPHHIPILDTVHLRGDPPLSLVHPPLSLVHLPLSLADLPISPAQIHMKALVADAADMQVHLLPSLVLALVSPAQNITLLVGGMVHHPSQVLVLLSLVLTRRTSIQVEDHLPEELTHPTISPMGGRCASVGSMVGVKVCFVYFPSSDYH